MLDDVAPQCEECFRNRCAEYWATRSVHSFPCCALLASFARSRARGKEVFLHDENTSISCHFNQLCALFFSRAVTNDRMSLLSVCNASSRGKLSTGYSILSRQTLCEHGQNSSARDSYVLRPRQPIHYVSEQPRIGM